MANSNTPYIISNASTAKYEIKKSLFIGEISPCNTEREAMIQLRKFISQHPDANHLAFAWRIRQENGFINERSNDGGEPSGTAGRPLLAPLEGNAIINAVVGVIRYFGGVKLGTGGLARAYGTAAKLAIEQATLSPWIEHTVFELVLDYSQLQLLEYHLKKHTGHIIEQQFIDKVTVKIHMPLDRKQAILNLFPDY